MNFPFSSCNKFKTSEKNSFLGLKEAILNKNKRKNTNSSRDNNNSSTNNLEIIDYPYPSNFNKDDVYYNHSNSKNLKTDDNEILNNESYMKIHGLLEERLNNNCGINKNNLNSSSEIINNENSITQNKIILKNLYLQKNLGKNNDNENNNIFQKNVNNNLPIDDKKIEKNNNNIVYQIINNEKNKKKENLKEKKSSNKKNGIKFRNKMNNKIIKFNTIQYNPPTERISRPDDHFKTMNQELKYNHRISKTKISLKKHTKLIKNKNGIFEQYNKKNILSINNIINSERISKNINKKMKESNESLCNKTNNSKEILTKRLNNIKNYKNYKFNTSRNIERQKSKAIDLKSLKNILEIDKNETKTKSVARRNPIHFSEDFYTIFLKTKIKKTNYNFMRNNISDCPKTKRNYIINLKKIKNVAHSFKEYVNPFNNTDRKIVKKTILNKKRTKIKINS